MKNEKCDINVKYDLYKTKLIDLNKFKKINIYLTGYGPFLNVKINSLQLIVEDLYKKKLELETEKTKILYYQIFEVKPESVDENKKKIFDLIKSENNSKDTLHIIISYGVAENRKEISIETLSENYIYDREKFDNVINKNNPKYFYSKAAVKTLVKGINKNEDFYCKYSCDAGTYLCNYIYYTTIDNYKNDDNVMSLFVHIPKIENCSIIQNEIFFKKLIHSLEICYLKGNENECKELIQIPNKKEDMNIDEWEINKNYENDLIIKL